MTVLVSMNGRIVDPDKACVSIFDHGFLFGDSVYEVVRSYQGRLFAWEPHARRLERSAEQLELAIPWPLDQLKGEARDLLRRKTFAGDAYIRLIITRGVGELSLDPSTCKDPQRIFIARPLQVPPPEVYREGLRLSLVDVTRNSRRSTDPGIKSGNYLNNVLALMEARAKGADEAVMLNEDGQVTECTTSNIFLIKGGRLKTPALDCGLLAGVTRAFVLDLAREANIPADETALRAEDVLEADELFITSTTRDIVPIRTVDERAWTPIPGPLTARLSALFQQERPRLLS